MIRRSTSVDVGARWSICTRWSSFVTARGPAVPLGVRWSLVDVCGAVVRYMRQVKAGVSHTGDRFSEPVLKPYGFVLRAVFVVNTWVCVPQECHVDFAVYASQAQPVHERVAERMKYLAAVSNAMCPYVAPKPLRERRLTRGARCYLWK